MCACVRMCVCVCACVCLCACMCYLVLANIPLDAKCWSDLLYIYTATLPTGDKTPLESSPQVKVFMRQLVTAALSSSRRHLVNEYCLQVLVMTCLCVCIIYLYKQAPLRVHAHVDVHVCLVSTNTNVGWLLSGMK